MHFLAVDQLASVLNLSECQLNVFIPLLHQVVCGLLPVMEHHYAVESVDLRLDQFVDHHVADLSLSTRHRHSKQFAQSLEPNL